MRTLRLRREQLSDLTADELSSVAGAGPLSDKVCIAIQYTVLCLPTHDCTGYYPSINAPCTQ
jgi:hypothetical protein